MTYFTKLSRLLSLAVFASLVLAGCSSPKPSPEGEKKDSVATTTTTTTTVAKALDSKCPSQTRDKMSCFDCTAIERYHQPSGDGYYVIGYGDFRGATGHSARVYVYNGTVEDDHIIKMPATKTMNLNNGSGDYKGAMADIDSNRFPGLSYWTFKP